MDDVCILRIKQAGKPMEDERGSLFEMSRTLF